MPLGLVLLREGHTPVVALRGLIAGDLTGLRLLGLGDLDGSRGGVFGSATPV